MEYVSQPTDADDIPETCPECGREWHVVVELTERGSWYYGDEGDICMPDDGYEGTDWRALYFIHA